MAAYEKLSESESKYRNILENIQDVYYRSDREGNLVMVSPSAFPLFGYESAEGFIGKSIDRLYVDPADRVRQLKAIQKQGSVRNYEIRLRHHDGPVVIVSTNSHYYFAPDGSVAGIEGMFCDITERKRAEETLQAQYLELERNQQLLTESDAKFRAILNQSYGFIGLTTTAGNLIEANEPALSFAGITMNEVRNLPFWETPWWKHSPEMQERIRDAVMRAALGEMVRFEATISSADGRIAVIDFSLKHAVDRSGNILFLIPEGRDITGWKLADEDLKKSENLYRTLFYNTGTATILVAPDTTILRANAGWERLTGAPREEQEGKISWTVFIDRNDVARMKEYHYSRRMNQDDAPTVYECRLVDISGRVHSCFVYVDMIPGTENSIASLVDISALKQAEEALRENELLLSLAQAISNVGSYCLDITSGTGTGSDEFFRILGVYRRYRFDVAELLTLIHPDDRGHISVHLSRDEAEPFSEDFRIVGHDGSTRFIHSEGDFFTSIDGKKKMIGIVQMVSP